MAGKKLRRRRKFSWYLIWFLVFSFFLSAVLLLMSTLPVWNIESIRVEGARFLNSEEISRVADRSIGKNIFFADFKAIEKELNSIDLLKKFRIKRDLPNILVIELFERQEAAVAVVNDKTVLFDEEGIILNLHNSSFAKYDLPSFSDLAVITGIRSSDIVEGKLKEEIKEMLSFLLKNLKRDMPDERIKIDISSHENVVLLVDDVIRVKVGGPSRLDEKIRAFLALRKVEQNRLQSIEYIDVRVPESPAVRFR